MCCVDERTSIFRQRDGRIRETMFAFWAVQAYGITRNGTLLVSVPLGVVTVT